MCGCYPEQLGVNIVAERKSRVIPVGEKQMGYNHSGGLCHQCEEIGL